MKILEAQQVGIHEMLMENIDVVIASSGYERRSTALAERLGKRPSGDKIALAFSEQKLLSREKNDLIFERLGYELESARGNEGSPMERLLERYLKNTDGRQATIVIDYSCMTRLWYAAAIRSLRELKRLDDRVNVFFLLYSSCLHRSKTTGGQRAYQSNSWISQHSASD